MWGYFFENGENVSDFIKLLLEVVNVLKMYSKTVLLSLWVIVKSLRKEGILCFFVILSLSDRFMKILFKNMEDETQIPPNNDLQSQ